MKAFKISDLPPALRAQLTNPTFTVGHHYHEDFSTGLHHPLPEQDAQLQSLGEDQDEERGQGRLRVRITRKGAKLLDKDNLYGSVKFVCDALRFSHLIPDDNPEAIELEVCQVKVPKEDRGTLIEIDPL